jgi:hypothetical protein
MLCGAAERGLPRTFGHRLHLDLSDVGSVNVEGPALTQPRKANGAAMMSSTPAAQTDLRRVRRAVSLNITTASLSEGFQSSRKARPHK